MLSHSVFLVWVPYYAWLRQSLAMAQTIVTEIGRREGGAGSFLWEERIGIWEKQ